MTCIVGLVDKGDVYIGGDSAGVSGYSISIRSDEKVFINGPFIMGFTSSFRMGQLLRYKLSVPKQTTDQDDMNYMVSDFVDSVRKCFKDNDYGKPDEGGVFLVGYNDKLYAIHSDFQVAICARGYDSVGCGHDIAKGSLFTSVGLKPEQRINLALSAASNHSAGVAPPFTIIKLSSLMPKIKKKNHKTTTLKRR
jgi:hypothetical protein